MWNKDEFKKLFEEYLATLDATEEDDHFGHERGIAKSVFEDFIEWLENRATGRA